MFQLIAVLPLILHGLAALAAGALQLALLGTPHAGLGLFLAPFVYTSTLVCLCMALARPFVGSVRAGRFRRASDDHTYLARRVYGAAWTTLYYCKPVYFLVLSIPLVKELVLRGFGYRGSAAVTLYPDSWVRDLPLLELGEGVYVANRATLGSNVVQGERITVDRIRLGARSVVGHLAMVGAGLDAGEEVEIGQAAAVGFHVRLGDGVVLGGAARVGHYSRLGSDVELGIGAIVGHRCRIAAGLRLPAGLVVPSGTRLETQLDVHALAAGSSLRPTGAFAFAV